MFNVSIYLAKLVFINIFINWQQFQLKTSYNKNVIFGKLVQITKDLPYVPISKFYITIIIK